MANCPICEKKLKKVDTMVFCENYKPKKLESGEWKNEGTCEFRVLFKNKLWGTMTPENVKTLLNGESVENKKHDKISLDVKNAPFFTKVEFAPKVEPEDF